MKIRRRELLDEFIDRHADAETAIRRWQDIVEGVVWQTPSELKSMFPNADYVGNERYVFNIRGNRYRLVVEVIFIGSLLTVRFIGTHAEYSRIECRTI